METVLVHERTTDMNERKIAEAYSTDSLGNTDLCAECYKSISNGFLLGKIKKQTLPFYSKWTLLLFDCTKISFL